MSGIFQGLVDEVVRTSNEQPRIDEGIGNPETWVNLYADPLFHYALLRTADKAIAEELVQETFVAALSTLSNNRCRGESAGKTWLTGILKHKISDHLRRKYRHQAQSFEEINAGLDDAIKHAKGKKSKVVVHKPETINVQAIRKKTGMSQQRFCATFGISLGTLRHWEQGLRAPRGTARVLLKVVDNNPSAVIKAINE